MAGKRSPLDTLFQTVVEGDYCIGCGMCAAFSPSIGMRVNARGQWQATLTDRPGDRAGGEDAAAVCPFADGNPNEDDLARELFPATIYSNGRIGRYLTNYAGYVREGSFRRQAGSGGLASWILCRLLDQRHVDAVVHVGALPPEAGQGLFGFVVSRTPEEVLSRAKSRYYPVEMSAVIGHMIENPGRYAVVGLPCFIKALRLACRQSAVLRSRVAHTVGLVCGHLKSRAFAEMMAWECAIPPRDLVGFDFRTKRDGESASSYAITATGHVEGREVTVTKPVVSLFGTNWRYGFFKYNACDYCDDVVAETADVAVGDAWLPEYLGDSGGTSVVVVRTQFFERLLTEGIATGALKLDELTADRVAESQDAGLRHRREGLSYRLEAAASEGRWFPSKRVKPGFFALDARQREMFRRRHEIAVLSHEAFLRARQSGHFEDFVAEMRPPMLAYDRLYRPGFMLRVRRRLARMAVDCWRFVAGQAAGTRCFMVVASSVLPAVVAA